MEVADHLFIWKPQIPTPHCNLGNSAQPVVQRSVQFSVKSMALLFRERRTNPPRGKCEGEPGPTVPLLTEVNTVRVLILAPGMERPVSNQEDPVLALSDLSVLLRADFVAKP